MKKFNTVIYDFDGTIGDTFDLHLEAYSFALEQFGIKVDRATMIKNCFNKTEKKTAEIFGIKEADLFTKYYSDRVVADSKRIPLYPGVVEVLESLKEQGYKLGFGTMRRAKETESIFEYLPIKKFFDEIVTFQETKNKNPKLEIYRKLSEMLNALKEEILFVGDSPDDMLAAKELGITSVLFYPPGREDFYKLEEFDSFRPNFIIKDHREVLNLLQ